MNKKSIITILALCAVTAFAQLFHVQEKANSVVIGNSTSELVGFYGTVAPVAQPTSASEAAAAAQTQDTLTDSTTGTASTTLAAIADLSTSNTYSDAALNAKLAIIRNYVATLAAQNAKIKADHAAVRTLVNQLRADLVSLNLIKGS